MNWINIAIVFIGSGLGGVCRYIVSRIVQEQVPGALFPWGTFAVNIIGCFLIGFFLRHFRPTCRSCSFSSASPYADSRFLRWLHYFLHIHQREFPAVSVFKFIDSFGLHCLERACRLHSAICRLCDCIACASLKPYICRYKQDEIIA